MPESFPALLPTAMLTFTECINGDFKLGMHGLHQATELLSSICLITAAFAMGPFWMQSIIFMANRLINFWPGISTHYGAALTTPVFCRQSPASALRQSACEQ